MRSKAQGDLKPALGFGLLKRNALVALGLMASLSGWFACAEASPASKPNIVFILADDIGEKRNLAAENRDKAKELQTKLAAWRKQVGALMPTPNPDNTNSSGLKKRQRETR